MRDECVCVWGGGGMSSGGPTTCVHGSPAACGQPADTCHRALAYPLDLLPQDVARYFFQQLVCGVAWCHRQVGCVGGWPACCVLSLPTTSMQRRRRCRHGRCRAQPLSHYLPCPAPPLPSPSATQGVCHRDVKLENTLLDGRPAPRLKICDFGCTKVRGRREGLAVRVWESRGEWGGRLWCAAPHTLPASDAPPCLPTPTPPRAELADRLCAQDDSRHARLHCSRGLQRAAGKPPLLLSFRRCWQLAVRRACVRELPRRGVRAYAALSTLNKHLACLPPSRLFCSTTGSLRMCGAAAWRSTPCS